MTWEKQNNIGHGQFGVVYSCRRESDPAGFYPWAMKQLQRDMAAVPQVVKRFEREAKILDSLDHENVMPVEACGVFQSGVPWLVMPRAERSLKDAIESGVTTDPEWTTRIFRGVLAGMAHAHDRKVLHRDLKPGNVLLFESDIPRVSDFGIAKQIDIDGTTLTITEAQLGTLRYIAPEQLANPKTAGPPADVYALGKILWHMLTGEPPASLGRLDTARVPEAFRFFVAKATRESPTQRYADADEALSAFESLLAPPEVSLAPVDLAKKIITQADAAVGGEALGPILRSLHDVFMENPENAVLYRKGFPAIKKRVIGAWIKTDLESFRGVLERYDSYAVDAVQFQYADVITDLYVYVFGVTDDLEIQRLLIGRLLETGYSNNRFYVHDQVVDLLTSLSKPAEVAVAAEAIDDHQLAADWYADEALKRSLAGGVAAALRRARDRIRDPLGAR